MMIGLSSSVSKHNICRIMIGLSLLSFVSKHNTVEFVYNEQVYFFIFFYAFLTLIATFTFIDRVNILCVLYSA
jgi:hypothetical protein